MIRLLHISTCEQIIYKMQKDIGLYFCDFCHQQMIYCCTYLPHYCFCRPNGKLPSIMLTTYTLGLHCIKDYIKPIRSDPRPSRANILLIRDYLFSIIWPRRFICCLCNLCLQDTCMLKLLFINWKIFYNLYFVFQ